MERMFTAMVAWNDECEGNEECGCSPCSKTYGGVGDKVVQNDE